MKKLIFSFISLFLLSSCATGKVTWYQPSKTDQQFMEDKMQCYTFSHSGRQPLNYGNTSNTYINYDARTGIGTARTMPDYQQMGFQLSDTIMNIGMGRELWDYCMKAKGYEKIIGSQYTDIYAERLKLLDTYRKNLSSQGISQCEQDILYYTEAKKVFPSYAQEIEPIIASLVKMKELYDSNALKEDDFNILAKEYDRLLSVFLDKLESDMQRNIEIK